MHTMVLGTTGSGKSSICKIIAARLQKKKTKVLVLDPIPGSKWPCNLQFRDKDELKNEFSKHPNSIIFVDESGEVINKHRDDLWFLATRSRHAGVLVYFIAQRVTQLPTVVRDQCSVLYLFSSSTKICGILAEEFNCEELKECSQLKPLHFIRCDRFGDLIRGKVDPVKGTVTFFDDARLTGRKKPDTVEEILPKPPINKSDG